MDIKEEVVAAVEEVVVAVVEEVGGMVIGVALIRGKIFQYFLEFFIPDQQNVYPHYVWLKMTSGFTFKDQ